MNPNVVLIAMLAAASVMLIVFGLGARRSSLEDLISAWEDEGPKMAGPKKTTKSLDQKIVDRVQAAGFPLKPREILAVWLGASIVLTGVFLLSAGAIGVSFFLGFSSSTVIGVAFINARVISRMRKFEDQLTRALTMLGSLLESGRSLPQALETVAEKTPDPLGPELRWVSRQYSVGVELADALIAVSRRVDSPEFRFFATAVDMNRVAGADLIGVLRSLVATLAERMSLRGELRARLAEVQLTKWVVSAAPVVAAVAFTVVSPEQMEPLYTTGQGAVIGLAAIAFWIGGIFTTSLMIKNVQP